MATESLLFTGHMTPVVCSVLSVVALVICDQYEFRPGRYLFKPMAALAFVWLATALGAAESTYGRWLLAGLLACMAGDLLLMPQSERSFLAGLVAFLCGHLLFAVAFMQLSPNITGLLTTALPALALMLFAARWLMPNVKAHMKLAVKLYIVVITGMLLSAGLSAGQPASLLIISGAWGFAVSDLAVARQRFVQASHWNGLWGTPLYFLSQMLLASSIALI